MTKIDQAVADAGDQMMRALMALRLEVPPTIVDNLTERFKAYKTARDNQCLAETQHGESLGALVDALRRGDAAEIAEAFRIAGMRLGIQSIADAPCIRVQPFSPAPGDGPYEQWSRWLLAQSAADLSAWSASQFSRLCTALAQVAPQGPEIPR